MMTTFATDSHSNNKIRQLKSKQEFFFFLKKARPSTLNHRIIWTRKLLRNACTWLCPRGLGNTERLLNTSHSPRRRSHARVCSIHQHIEVPEIATQFQLCLRKEFICFITSVTKNSVNVYNIASWTSVA